MDRLMLLDEARAAGLRVRAEGDRLRVTGPRKHEALARKLLAQKPAILAALRGNGKRGSAGEPPGNCFACRGRRFWRHAVHGHWLCARCHPAPAEHLIGEARGEDPAPAGPADWGPELEPVVSWFLKEGQHQIPAKPFKLAPWLHVTNPNRFRKAMLIHLASGPEGPRNRFGSVEEDLLRVARLLGGGGPAKSEVPGSEERKPMGGTSR